MRGYLAFEHGGYVRGFELPEGIGKGQEEEESGEALHGREGNARAVCARPAVCREWEITHYKLRITKGNGLIHNNSPF